VAAAVGTVAGGSAVCLALLFTVGQPFGTLNDLGNAAVGVLSAGLAWRMRRAIPGRAGAAAVGAALGGSAVSVAGSAMVISGTTGFLLAGLVSSVGFAGVGAWLIALNRSVFARAEWPDRLRLLGLVTGGLMASGVVALPGVALRIDDLATAPWWVWLGFAGWIGLYFSYPVWAIWLGRLEARGWLPDPVATTVRQAE
jgi:hypothetical protein